MRYTHFLSMLLWGGSALASPLTQEGGAVLVARGGKIVTAVAAIEAIMPNSTSCEGATDECRTAQQAAPFLIDAMKGYSLGQIGAMLALISVESVDMKFKHNVFPGRPGQGTSNMMMSNFVKEYATEKLGAAAVEGKSEDEVLALVTPDKYNFGSAPWFLTTKCPNEKKQLLGGTQASWLAYMKCVNVGDLTDPGRVAAWERAQKVFGLNGF